MNLLRAIIHFFKTWFLPLPAHDDDDVNHTTGESSEALPENRDDDNPQSRESQDDEIEPEILPRKKDRGEPDEDELFDDDDPDYPELDPPTPLNPVAPPEGADERQSRSSARPVEPPPAE